MKKHMLNALDIVNVLCHYKIEKCRFPINYFLERVGENYRDDDDNSLEDFRGFSIDDKKEILIDSELGLEDMRETMIHEFYHCYHYLKGDLDGKNFGEVEKIVQMETDYFFKNKK